MKKIVCICIILGFFFSCEKFSIDDPEGFAKAIPGSGYYYKAISPEGMIFKVRKEDNYPEKDIIFWSNALKNKLEKEGYKNKNSGDKFTAGDNEGDYFEWIVHYNNRDWIYLTAIIISGEKIIIAEAVGEHGIYKIYRDQLLKSIKSISID